MICSNGERNLRQIPYFLITSAIKLFLGQHCSQTEVLACPAISLPDEFPAMRSQSLVALHECGKGYYCSLSISLPRRPKNVCVGSEATLQLTKMKNDESVALSDYLDKVKKK